MEITVLASTVALPLLISYGESAYPTTTHNPKEEHRMKKVLAIVAGPLALSLALAVEGMAQQQQPTTPPADRPSTTQPADRPGATPRDTFRNSEGLHESSDLIGTRIKNAQGKDIGELDQLLIDPKDGKISHAVVGVGGFLGVGEKQLVVPWSDVKVAPDHRGGKAVVTMDQATLEKAPRYEKRVTSGDTGRTPAASPATTPRTEPKPETEKK
jgi:sporulation protein YlmC with PRC-barrel domain